jgi:putative ATP-dependent endonuclease of OLD family
VKLIEARIRSFRSIENETIRFGNTTVFFGKNDSGKSNILKALEFALTRGYPEEADIRITSDNQDPRSQSTSVDVLFLITDNVEGADTEEYEKLTSYLSENTITIDERDRGLLAFRAELSFNREKDRYEKTHRVINDWDDPNSIGIPLPAEAFDVLDFILLDAHRDISETIRDRRSRWNSELSQPGIDEERAASMDAALSSLGKEIVDASPFLTRAQNELRNATDRPSSEIEISPISRNLGELYRGLDIIVQEENKGVGLPMSQSGSGTRSRAVFMLYKSLLDLQLAAARKSDIPYFCLVAFEEPEAHVHPQSQQQLLDLFSTLGTQRVVTTHSPYILSVASLDDLCLVRRDTSATTCISLGALQLDNSQKREVSRYIMRSHGELLFADAVILGEGETEEQAIPVFFEHRFGCHPFAKGVAVLEVGGVKYDPFLMLFNLLGTQWFILSDGEERTLNTVRSQLKKSLGLRGRPDLASYPQIVIWGNGNDYEAGLLEEGYAEEMVEAIDVFHGGIGDGSVFEQMMRRDTGYDSTDDIYGYLPHFMNSRSTNKTRCARAVAEAIANNVHGKPPIPPTIDRLFDELSSRLGW